MKKGDKKIKYVVTLMVCLLLGISVYGQNPGYNYIRVRSPRTKISSNTVLDSYTSNKDSVSVLFQYVDGLGRPLQNVQQQGSPTGKDIIQPFIYDNQSRDSIKYLPYTIASPTPGAYQPNAITSSSGYSGSAQYQFYQQSGQGYINTQYPYTATAYEPSTENRVQEQGAPGTSWQLSTSAISGSGHTVKLAYASNDQSVFSTTPSAGNTGSRMVALYTVTVNPDQSRRLTRTNNNATYPTGTLTVTITKDENWNSATDGCLNTTEEYKDLEGNVVLKRTYNKVGTTLQMLSTYYVYDDFNNLCYVLPPGANPDANAAIATATINNMCYQYRYDERGRLTQKKIPGKGWDFVVYNTIDQVIGTQDSLQRTQAPQQVSYTKYDAQGRQVISGYYTITGSTAGTNYLTSLQTSANGQSTLWESRATTTYSNATIPTTGATMLATTYYDDYNLTGIPSTNVKPGTASVMTRGLATATVSAVLNTPANTLWKINYYDDLGRTIQTYGQHYLGGVVSVNNYDLVTSSYDFTNEVTATTRKHYNSTSTTAPILTIANTYVYDHMGRKKQSWIAIANGSAALPTALLLSQADYNEVGQLMTKHLHSTNSGTSYLQNISYAYNERGWLKTSSAPLFALQLNYNDGTTPQYNGNISNQLWGTPGSLTKNYAYKYDNLNRLVSGIASTGNTEKSIVYDVQGNITGLQRYLNSTEVDGLKYSYLSGTNPTNQLQSITDSTTNDAGMKHGTFTYAYDGNGNMITDNSKGLTTAYNILNLPYSNTLTGTSPGTVTYTYDAGGAKLRRVSTQGTGISTDYIDGIEYDATGSNTPTITFIQTEEGRALPTGSTYNYEYNLADYLGDTRYTFDTSTGAARAEQQDDYMPFGMDVSVGTIGSPQNYYLYNKKELQPQLGLYDYGARFYDPVIGRWTSVDPLAEKSRRWSPYNYAIDDPIRFVDPDGKEIINIQGGVRFTGEDAKVAFTSIKQQYQTSVNFKIHFVYESKTKEIYKHTLDAFRQGKPEVLHYDADVNRKDERRKEALAGYPKKGDGTERDEYPYASTFEGGAGAAIAYVPWLEQRSQGGSLKALYNTMTQGEAFIVIPVPKDKEPDKDTQPSPSPSFKPTFPILPLPTTLPNVPLPTVPELPTLPELPVFPELPIFF